MIGAQGRFFLFDEIVAGLVRVTGWPLPAWFLILQAVALTAIYGGAVLIGRAVLVSGWAVTAWIAALTLRHRIAQAGVNTLESYFHPRVLVCGLGLVSVGLLLHRRPWWALGLAMASAALHPTTAACFVVIVGAGVLATEPKARLPIAAVTAVAGLVVGGRAWSGGGPFDLTVMDAGWRALVATKDYTFPTEWSPTTWAINLLGPVVLAFAAAARWRRGLGTAAERGVAVGALLLVAGFLAALPLVDRGVALAVQLQTSRVFWPVELLATLYLVWWIAEARGGAEGHRPAGRRLAVGLIVLSVLRAVHVGFLENPRRPAFAAVLPADEWTSALRWIALNTPHDAFVMADPGHAWKFGTAVRIGAERDVFLEEIKDVAMAIYSRQTAMRTIARIDAASSFAEMDAAGLQRLAAAEGLTLVVTERPLDLPVLHASGAVRVYRLGS